MTINLTARNLALGGISLLTADAWNLCEATMIVQEFVNFLLMAKFHTEHPSSHPQTPREYVLSSWLCNSIFFVFIGEV